MAKYSQHLRPHEPDRDPTEVHAIWRGIGCIFMIIIPIMAYAGAIKLVDQNLENKWVPPTQALYQTVTLPVIGPVPHLYANLIVAVLLCLLGYAVVVFFYTLFYKFAGPPRLGPLDAEPIRSSQMKATRKF